jgi:hypothetical protein
VFERDWLTAIMRRPITMQNPLRLASLLLLAATGFPLWAEEVSGTFTVFQSQGLGLEGGDKVRVELTVDPAAEGVEGRGMAGTPVIRYATAVTAVSIQAGEDQFDFTQPLDVIVAPLQNQWTATWLDVNSGLAPPVESELPILQAMTVSFRYEADALPLDTPVPPPGALTAGQSAIPRFGLDLMVRGHHGDRREGWTIMGRFESMSSRP